MAYGGVLAEVSNRASWIDCFELRDSETDEEIDFSTAQEIVLQLVAVTYDNFFRYDYSFTFGGVTGALMITATLTGGQITIIQPGIFQVAFPRTMMNALVAGDYNCGVTIVKDDQTEQLFAGQVRVIEGFVTVQAGSM
jgi:hypothetical protein